MKTIKIFLASSEELTDDRNAFGNLVRRLDKIYEKRGIRIELFEWEDYDAAYNDRRKQDEYNDQIKESDMFLALFHTKAGKFTIEEFDVATEEFKKYASPKVYTYCKDLKEGEQESPELTEFKRRLFNEMGHYWSRYNNRDSMQLHFVMQLQLLETSGVVEKLKVKEGKVMLAGMPIATLDNLRFAAGNEAYQKIKTDLADLPDEIDMLRMMVESHPEQQKYKDQLQKKLDKYNHIKEEFDQLQKALFDTAQRIASMQLERVSDLLRRAIEAFEEGNIERANTLLDEIADEADHHMEQLDRDREMVHQDIEAFLLQTKTVMADASLPIDERIQKTTTIYTKADDWAQKSNYDKKKYRELLTDYALFLSHHGSYEMCLSLLQRVDSFYEGDSSSLELSVLYSYKARTYMNLHDYENALTNFQKSKSIHNDLYGDRAFVYNIFVDLSIGEVYQKQSQYMNALDYFLKSHILSVKVFGKEDITTISISDKIGQVHADMGDYTKAYAIFQSILAQKIQLYGKSNIEVADSFQKLGNVAFYMCRYDEALSHYLNALDIRNNIIGLESLEVADSLCSIGTCYEQQHDYSSALDSYKKAEKIRKNILGSSHPLLAEVYRLMGGLFLFSQDNLQAKQMYEKALNIYNQIYEEKDEDVAEIYDSLGEIYREEENITLALKYYEDSCHFREQKWGENHYKTSFSYERIADLYYEQGNYSGALELFLKALAPREKAIGKTHISIATLYQKISYVYAQQEDFEKSLEYSLKTLPFCENNIDHSINGVYYSDISMNYTLMGDFDHAMHYAFKSLETRIKIFGKNSEETAIAYEDIGSILELKNDVANAEIYYQKANEIRLNLERN